MHISAYRYAFCVCSCKNHNLKLVWNCNLMFQFSKLLWLVSQIFSFIKSLHFIVSLTSITFVPTSFAKDYAWTKKLNRPLLLHSTLFEIYFPSSNLSQLCVGAAHWPHWQSSETASSTPSFRTLEILVDWIRDLLSQEFLYFPWGMRRSLFKIR